MEDDGTQGGDEPTVSTTIVRPAPFRSAPHQPITPAPLLDILEVVSSGEK
jgi:hypothetical protein